MGPFADGEYGPQSLVAPWPTVAAADVAAGQHNIAWQAGRKRKLSGLGIRPSQTARAAPPL
eukprot:14005962-Alexandrium_andersonii.AAC.1